MNIETNRTFCMDCVDGIPLLEDGSVNLVMTSSPYAMQRKDQYGGVPESEYPAWTLRWCELMRPKLAQDASICINICPHVKNGVVSDYVLRTRLALREAGWYEPDELIWVKTNAFPLGDTKKPKRAWESILWFAPTNKPKCFPKAAGHVSDRVLNLVLAFFIDCFLFGKLQLRWLGWPLCLA